MCTNCASCANFINMSATSNRANLSGVATLTSLQILHWNPHRNLKDVRSESSPNNLTSPWCMAMSPRGRTWLHVLFTLPLLKNIPYRNRPMDSSESIGFLHFAHHVVRPFPYMHHERRLSKPTPGLSMANESKNSTIWLTHSYSPEPTLNFFHS